MSFRIGINGFGRIGRLLARHIAGSQGHLVLAHLNDPALSPAQAAHLISFDSVHGRWPHDARVQGEALRLGHHLATFSAERDPARVPWGERVDLVIDCTGRIKDRAGADAFLAAGAPRLLVSQPVEDIPNIVMGINDRLHDLHHARAVSAASCTTNCLAPVASVIDAALGIRHGFITTVHAMTNDQALLDQGHGDWRRGRSAGESLIPTSSGFAHAIGRVLPELSGRLDGFAVRAPVSNASLIDCSFLVDRHTTAAAVNLALEMAAEGTLNGILAVESRPLVSADYLDDPHSATVDAALTQVQGGQLVKVVAWYDNETGYSRRLADVAARMAKP